MNGDSREEREYTRLPFIRFAVKPASFLGGIKRNDNGEKEVGNECSHFNGDSGKVEGH